MNQYRLCTVQPRAITGLSPILTFTTPDASRYPVPDPRYLAIHAACAKVVHYSGAGDYIEKILCDIEEMGVLANNGCSDALYHALLRHADVEVP